MKTEIWRVKNLAFNDKEIVEIPPPYSWLNLTCEVKLFIFKIYTL